MPAGINAKGKTMNNRKQKAVMTILAMLLCLSLGIGLTYAFFTDVVKNKGNNIMSGEIDVDLELLHESGNWYPVSDAIFQEGQDNEDDEDYDDDEDYEDDEDDDYYDDEEENYVGIFNYDNWEPGFTEVKLLRVANKGDFALEWRLRIIIHCKVTALANAIDVYVKMGDEQFDSIQKTDFTAIEYGSSTADGWKKVGTLAEFFKNAQNDVNGTLAKAEYDYFGIALHMREDAGNEYQGLSIDNFEIKIEAIQLNHESDALGSDYDEEPEYPDPLDDLVFTLRTDPETGEQYYSVSSYNGPFQGWDDPNADEYWREMHYQYVTIPSTYNGLPVKEIDAYAFYDREVVSVEIPSSIIKIGDEAFIYCQYLTEVNIPSTVTTIPYGAFLGCTSLEKITIPNSVTEIGESAFADCRSLKQIQIPDSVTTIGEGAFLWCDSLETIVIPDSVTNLGTHVFMWCQSLVNVTLPSNLTTISGYMFHYCTSLKTIDIPASVTTIEDRAFSGAGFETFAIPNTVTSIGYGILSGCPNLTSVTVPGSIQHISDEAFGGCLNLEYIILNEGVQSIGSNAFYANFALKEVVIPASVTTISEDSIFSPFDIYEYPDGTACYNIKYLGTGQQWILSRLGSQLESPFNSYYGCYWTYKITCSDGEIFTLSNYYPYYY